MGTHLAALIPEILTCIFVGIGITKYILEFIYKGTKSAKTKRKIAGFLDEITKIENDIETLKMVPTSPEVNGVINAKKATIATINKKIEDVKNGK